ncbi:hypothetical protein [Paracoccus xiamenensis]|uniref:hypothetical protein n=1 Tax=Paracoccus xiamenensis TaxID=2714901 RepID=UPI001408A4E6|nr:hypothetical protein [Paracoccus xiamenensis]NHF71538.1 hypothetical protein [Paracoccus xiamenensis]
MQVQILPGSPKNKIKAVGCAEISERTCSIVQDFPAFAREHVKNTGTKPVQPDPAPGEFRRYSETKNPCPAATGTGIKSKTKALSFLCQNSTRYDRYATIGLFRALHTRVLP